MQKAIRAYGYTIYRCEWHTLSTFHRIFNVVALDNFTNISSHSLSFSRFLSINLYFRFKTMGIWDRKGIVDNWPYTFAIKLKWFMQFVRGFLLFNIKLNTVCMLNVFVNLLCYWYEHALYGYFSYFYIVKAGLWYFTLNVTTNEIFQAPCEAEAQCAELVKGGKVFVFGFVQYCSFSMKIWVGTRCHCCDIGISSNVI